MVSLGIAIVFVAPMFTGSAASEEATLPTRHAIGFGVDVASATSDPRSLLAGMGDLVGLIDDPGAPYGFPNDNTLGFTTKGTGLDVWRWDYQGPIDVEVDMGKLVKKKDIAAEEHYILEMYFSLIGWFWNDGDGVYDPAPGIEPGYGGDDPCPAEPFKLLTVFVNGQKIRTLEGHNTQPCTPGGPETSRTFEIIPIGNDLPNQVRVPKNLVREGKNTVRIVVEDFVTGPPNNPYHTETNDGFEMYLSALAMELAAPPLVLSHGWTPEFSPATGTVPWQPTFKANIKNEFAAHTGQDPWRWATLAGKDAILLNFYDKKQDFRISARELRTNVQTFHQQLGFAGKGWMHGHSMGGLGSRYYLEILGGNAKIEKFAQTGSPNLGSWEAHVYTYGYWMNYEAVDGDYTAKWHWTLPGWPFNCCLEVWHGWRDWWNPNIWAYQYYDGPGHGRDHLADFELKPPGSNPVLAMLNANFPAAGVEYFTVRGDCTILTSKSCLLSGYHWRGDGAVGLDSATMNGAIRHRTINEFHEDIPARVETARWMVRYWGGLDLDNGKPLALDDASFLPSALAPLDQELHEVPRAHTGAATLSIRATDLLEGPYEHRILVDDATQADFVAFVVPTEDPLRVGLRAPDGMLYEPDTAFGSVEYAESTGAYLRAYRYAVTDPAPGEWTMLLAPGDVPPAEGMPVAVGAFLQGAPIEMTARASELRYAPGLPATLLATLTENGAPFAGASVVASTMGADGAPTSVHLLDDGAHGDGAAGDGVHGAFVPTDLEDSATRWDVVATGMRAGAPFSRSADVEVVVATLADVRLASLLGTPAGAWGGDAATLEARVVSEGERALRGGATVQFYDGDPALGGALLGSVEIEGDIPVGETRAVALDIVVPSHAFVVHARVDSSDLESDFADNALASAMPFVGSPKTAATILGSPGSDGWYLGPAIVVLAPFDGSAPAGITYVRIDGIELGAYPGPFSISSEGPHTVEFWTVDWAGHVEPTRSVSVGVDIEDPSASLVSPTPGFVHALDVAVASPVAGTFVVGLVDVVISASDPSSGVASVRLTLDGDPAGEAAVAEDGLWRARWDSSATSTGDHTLGWIVTDAAGRSTAGALRVYVVAARGVEVERDPYALVNRLLPGGP